MFQIEEKVANKQSESNALLELFANEKALSKCQELYDIAAHSKTYRRELQLEAIRINDNFHSISGFFLVGRFLDYLGKTIPDNVDRSKTTYEEYRILMDDACRHLHLSSDDAYKLKSKNVYGEYARENKKSDKLPFKALFANAILNNLECGRTEFFYKEVVSDAWYLYDNRSKVDHSNEHIVLSDEDIKKLTRLSRFIISIQGGEML